MSSSQEIRELADEARAHVDKYEEKLRGEYSRLKKAVSKNPNLYLELLSVFGNEQFAAALAEGISPVVDKRPRMQISYSALDFSHPSSTYSIIVNFPNLSLANVRAVVHNYRQWKIEKERNKRLRSFSKHYDGPATAESRARNLILIRSYASAIRRALMARELKPVTMLPTK